MNRTHGSRREREASASALSGSSRFLLSITRVYPNLFITYFQSAQLKQLAHISSSDMLRLCVCVCVLVWGLRLLTTWIVTPRAWNPLSAGLWHDLEAARCLLPLCVTPISYIARTRRYPFKSTRFRPYLQLQWNGKVPQWTNYFQIL